MESNIETKIEELKKTIDELQKKIDDASKVKKQLEIFLTSLINMKTEGSQAVDAALNIVKTVEASRTPKQFGGKISTGVVKLDDLMYGGLNAGTNTVVSGEAFSTKDVLAYNFILKSIQEGIPVIIISNDLDIREIYEEIMALSKKDLASIRQYEEAGIIRFIDMYSKTIQIESASQKAVIIDNPSNISALLRTVESMEEEIIKTYPYYRLVMFSLTTLIPQIEEKVFLRFGQQFTQKRRINRAACLYLLEEGIFDQKIYETVNYIMDGNIEFKRMNGKEYLRVLSTGRLKTKEWVEVYPKGTSFDLGSFSLERIR
ncbi:RAD55 family ATPase [Caldiplasma sukawensis]